MLCHQQQWFCNWTLTEDFISTQIWSFSPFPVTLPKILLSPSAKQTAFTQLLQSHVEYKHAPRTQPRALTVTPFQQRAISMQFQVTIISNYLSWNHQPVEALPPSCIHRQTDSFAFKSQHWGLLLKEAFPCHLPHASFLQSWRREVPWRQVSICNVQSAQSVLTVCVLQGSRDEEQSS